MSISKSAQAEIDAVKARVFKISTDALYALDHLYETHVVMVSDLEDLAWIPREDMEILESITRTFDLNNPSNRYGELLRRLVKKSQPKPPRKKRS